MKNPVPISNPPQPNGGNVWGGWARAKLQLIPSQVRLLQTHHHHNPPGFERWLGGGSQQDRL